MLLNMESGYHIVTICVIWTSWAHVWRLRSLFLRTGYDTALPFPPPLSHRGQPAPASLQPIRPRPKHHTVVHNLPALQAVDHHPRMPSPPSFPSGRPHLTVDVVLLASFFLPSAAVAERPTLSRWDGPPAQVAAPVRSRPASFGPFAQCNLPFFHVIKNWLIQIKLN
jgi:hypothetical protein